MSVFNDTQKVEGLTRIKTAGTPGPTRESCQAAGGHVGFAPEGKREHVVSRKGTFFVKCHWSLEAGLDLCHFGKNVPFSLWRLTKIKTPVSFQKVM